MLDYRLFRHQNFFKKNLKKVRFSTEKLQNLRKKMPFLQKKFQDFFALNSFFLLYFLTAIRKNQKMGSLSSFGGIQDFNIIDLDNT